MRDVRCVTRDVQRCLTITRLGRGLHIERATRGAASGERRHNGLGSSVEGAGVAGLLQLGAHVAVVAGGGGRGGETRCACEGEGGGACTTESTMSG